MCSADKDCLRVHFFNVGDGDSILIEAYEGGNVFRLLIDAGRMLESPPAPCANCADHLLRLGVTRLNLVLITHLHEDHFCGLDGLIGRVQIDELLCAYVPERPELPIPPEPGAIKTIQGMINCLNRWTVQLRQLEALGCKITRL